MKKQKSKKEHPPTKKKKRKKTVNEVKRKIHSEEWTKKIRQMNEKVKSERKLKNNNIENKNKNKKSIEQTRNLRCKIKSWCNG